MNIVYIVPKAMTIRFDLHLSKTKKRKNGGLEDDLPFQREMLRFQFNPI